MVCFKIVDIKKSFLLNILLVVVCNINNICASYADSFQLIGCSVPALALSIGKAIYENASVTTSNSLWSNSLSNFSQNSPGIKTQVAVIFINVCVDYGLLTYKKNILAKTDTFNKTLTAQRNMPLTIAFAGFGELVVLYLMQCAVLYWQNKLTFQTVRYAGFITLVNVVPGIWFILRKKVSKKEDDGL